MLSNLLEQLSSQPELAYIYAGIMGLVVGSFLNVVITRLPAMLEQSWQDQAAAILDAPAKPQKTFNLITPRSCCPQCRAPIKAWQNIPIISFILLRGRCSQCQQRISWQYPFIELAACLLAILSIYRFGVNAAGLAAIIFSWALLTLSAIDWHTKLLPDVITLPLLWLGLLIATQNVFLNPVQAIIGAAAGYLVLWGVFHLFKLITGKEGMGYGDFKLLAALGAWVGWTQLPLILLIASTSGAIIGLGLNLHRDKSQPNHIPFGPFLALGGWLSLVAGDTILNSYFSIVGLT